MTRYFSACGKQLFIAGDHLADARDPDAAQAIVILLNTASWMHEIPHEDRAKVREVFGGYVGREE